MAKETVPVITAEDVAKCDASATARATADIALIGRGPEEEAAEEAEPKPHKHYYPKGSDTCACGYVRKSR